MPRRATAEKASSLVLVLGDQLTPTLSSLAASDKRNTVVLMVEVMQEATYVRHHKKKIAFLFAAMRHFAAELQADGWTVDYRRLDETGVEGSFTSEVKAAIERHAATRIIVTGPGEYRILADMQTWQRAFNLPVQILDDDRFVATRADFECWASGRKQLRMEYFYRDMRRKTGLLMDGDKPVGGQWNFDHDNRKPAKADLLMPKPAAFKPDKTTQQVLDLVAARFTDHIGDIEPFTYAVTRKDAETALAHFVKHALPSFGDYQDAMVTGEPFLYHSLLSAYINAGLLDPLSVCRAVEAAWKKGRVPLNAAEGFIRQIIGWREYVRGIYWLKMPDYVTQNYFGHARPVPDFYWDAKTDMACVKAAVKQTIEHAYAHHIQRLMVTGNFALLAGISPQALHEWYLMVYIDAYEWVELPNTLGMSQFGDGGVLASKPYVASGAYINRMSNYCKGCRYDVKDAVGPKACPFNALYWGFLDRHRDKLGGNPRMTQMYRTWATMAADKRKALLTKAADTLAKLDSKERL